MIGENKIYGGQRYECVGEEPHTRRDGLPTVLGIWESQCASCSARFTFKYSINGTSFVPNRRCADCKRPGFKVRHERKAKPAKRFSRGAR